MNTVKRGDLLEDRVFDIIVAALKEKRLGLHSEFCRVYQKPRYYSRLRENNIIFDLSIEVWPPSAQRCHLLYLIECKDYSGTVPVSDIEEFIAKIQQVAGPYVKGVFVTTGDIQESGMTLLRNLNFMFIKVSGEHSEIILHSSDRTKSIQKDLPVYNIKQDLKLLGEIRRLYEHQQPDTIDWEKVISNFLQSELSSSVNWEQHAERAQGLEYLSKKLITNLTEQIINDFDGTILAYGKPFPIERFMSYLTETYGLKFVTDKAFNKSKAHLNGYYDRRNKVIHINPSICINQFAFICAHEIGHFFLHEKLAIPQSSYDSQQASKYDPKTRRHLFEKEKHWIEWQANFFAGCLLMPLRSLVWQLIEWQGKAGLNKRGYIWLDNQPCNILDFKKAMTILGYLFGVSRSMLRIRMADLKIIRYSPDLKSGNYSSFEKYKLPKPFYQIIQSPRFHFNFEDDLKDLDNVSDT